VEYGIWVSEASLYKDITTRQLYLYSALLVIIRPVAFVEHEPEQPIH
jgi:hypothetical protein